MIIMGAGGCVRGGMEPAGERHSPKKFPRDAVYSDAVSLNTQICSHAVSIQDNYSLTFLWSTEELEKQCQGQPISCPSKTSSH